MIDKAKILADSQGRQFSDVLADPHAPVQDLLDLVNRSGQWMSFVTTHLGLPALAAIIRELEQIDEVKKFFRTKSITTRFKQFTGVVVRMKMEEESFTTTGIKGYLPKLSWYTKSEIYQPRPNHPHYRMWHLAQTKGKAA